MRNLLENHYDKILIVLAVIFSAGVVFMYIWGAGFLVKSFNNSTEARSGGAGEIHFNVNGAEKLNLVK